MDPKRSSDIDLLTLVIAAVASGVAAYVTSQVWQGGTLFSAALTPVIVALVKEALNRPADRVSTLRTDRLTTEQPAAEPSPLHPPVNVYGRSGRRWKVALLSGVAAFLVVVAVFTVPELVAGKSVGRKGDSATTLFGGTRRKASKTSTRTRSRSKSTGSSTATATPTPSATATDTPTPTATPSPTTTATASPTPTASAPPTPSAAATTVP